MQLHIDINSGEKLELARYASINANEATCLHIISTLLNIVSNDVTLPNKPLSLSLYLVEDDEGKLLNNDYRGKDYATNVLSFPSDVADLPAEILNELDDYPLGELIICLPVVIKQASEQQKKAQDHFTHLLIHGCLHLLGYDHELSENVTQADADAMEALEIAILAKLGIANPY